uniref:Sulphate adenylyltransferase catalytic domain-containing protein n=1 Tax=Ditylenchus dipsaci TaxID=166011 RepID=A0A915CTV3_9BILA
MQKDFPKPKESRGHRILNLNEAFSKLVANQPKSSVKPVVDPLNQSIPYAPALQGSVGGLAEPTRSVCPPQQERIHRQFGYSDLRHPAIKLIHDSGDWLLGGELEVMDRIRFNDGLDEYRKTPKELRQHFQDAGDQEGVVEALQQPMLLLHPLGGWTKDDDVPLAVRIQQHQAVLQAGVLDPKWTVLAIFPSPMLYAGPTEVQWHARARLACGIKAYIVGRDPAGIPDQTGDYLYDPSHGAKVLTMAPGLPNLEIIPFRVAAYDHKQQKMVFVEESHAQLCQTRLCPPDGFMCPEAWGVLAKHYTKELPDADATKEEQ